MDDGRDLFIATLLPRRIHRRGGHPRRIRSWRAGADNNPFRLLGRIAMAIQRIPQLVSHE